MDHRREARDTRKVTARNRRSRADNRHRDNRSRHGRSIHRRIAGVSEGGISRSELILRNVDVRALHQPFPTTSRAWEIISTRTAQLVKVSRVALKWSQMFPDKTSGFVFDKRRSQRSSDTSEHLENIERTSIKDSRDISDSRSSAEVRSSTCMPLATHRNDPQSLGSLTQPAQSEATPIYRSSPDKTNCQSGRPVGVCGPEFALIGARMLATESRGLRVSTFPGMLDGHA
ncbi:hypothetical protein CRG98_006155 [Punica granatum]|uniref:Uncharacterized protein n=1 Tax=Punica granatum TaxID=22663 RepID=A0A2I0KYB5_PUNGR|nr:hypothetical protein CRG98_006155 [Punica granatum]